MKKALGVLLILVGFALGLYVGVWLLFIGGILDLAGVVNQIVDGNGLDAIIVAWGVIKIMLAGFAGAVCAYAGILPGIVMLNNEK